MLDVGWTELVVIAIVLIIVVGPKDLPPMLRSFGRMTAKMRGMAADFRRQFDEALREADLDEVRKTISDAQSLNPTTALRDAMNPLRQLGNEIKSDLQKATTPDKPPQEAVPEPTVEPARVDTPVEAAVKPADAAAAAAIGSASLQADRAAGAAQSSEAKPAAKRKAAAPSKKPAAAKGTQKTAAVVAPTKASVRKAASEGQAEAGIKTRASRKKGDA
ncbi:preprotein translocase [Sinorhizobium saheli]|uniref:Sec-independent protein translocase protein TatB n=1 Tax=Sinorhizobium saheli TaxID=36856 RepID=A0A178YDH6_SINSA|nr:Sec-independent protein translocase protein TatB [Sinorhizobium saheli]OAP45392.1 preprotein translocase [Sinorhizobium saheli]